MNQFTFDFKHVKDLNTLERVFLSKAITESKNNKLKLENALKFEEVFLNLFLEDCGTDKFFSIIKDEQDRYYGVVVSKEVDDDPKAFTFEKEVFVMKNDKYAQHSISKDNLSDLVEFSKTNILAHFVDTVAFKAHTIPEI